MRGWGQTGLPGEHQENRGVRVGRQAGTGPWSAFGDTIVTTTEADGAKAEAPPNPREPGATAVRGAPTRGFPVMSPPPRRTLRCSRLAPERTPPSPPVVSRLGCVKQRRKFRTRFGGRQSTLLNDTFLPRTQRGVPRSSVTGCCNHGVVGAARRVSVSAKARRSSVTRQFTRVPALRRGSHRFLSGSSRCDPRPNPSHAGA